jgi:putative transposase
MTALRLDEPLRRMAEVPKRATDQPARSRHLRLHMQTPSLLYQPSARPYRGLEELEYQGHDWTAVITTCARICTSVARSTSARSLPDRKWGQTGERAHWARHFMHYDLGYFDDQTCRLEPIDNPFGPKLLPMSPE